MLLVQYVLSTVTELFCLRITWIPRDVKIGQMSVTEITEAKMPQFKKKILVWMLIISY